MGMHLVSQFNTPKNVLPEAGSTKPGNALLLLPPLPSPLPSFQLIGTPGWELPCYLMTFALPG